MLLSSKQLLNAWSSMLTTLGKSKSVTLLFKNPKDFIVVSLGKWNLIIELFTNP
jgi:hypothetical protein